MVTFIESEVDEEKERKRKRRRRMEKPEQIRAEIEFQEQFARNDIVRFGAMLC